MINRREFLKLLVGAGAAVSLPFDLSSATKTQVEDAWALISHVPVVFDVEDKTIYAPWGEYPQTYGDIVDIDIDPNNRDSILQAIEEIYDLYHHFYYAFEDAAGVEGSLAWRLFERLGMDDGLDAWFKKAPVTDLSAIVDCWLASELPIGYELPLQSGPTGEAYGFFLSQDYSILKALGVIIIEGEHPGSSYYAAELRLDVTEANYAAAALDLPIRFREVA